MTPSTSQQMLALLSCTSLMLYVGSSTAVKRQLRAWSKNESQIRADPLPINLLLAMVGAALKAQKMRIAMSLLIGFHTLLRTNEMVHIQASHFTFPQKCGPVLLVLPLTKLGQRLQKRPRNSHSHRPLGPYVCLGCGTQAPAR